MPYRISAPVLGSVSFMFITLGSVAISPSAFAQGQNKVSITVPSGSGICPSGWMKGRGWGVCDRAGPSTPSVYIRASTSTECASGYYVDRFNERVCTTQETVRGPSAEVAQGKGGEIDKANAMMRCPTGWRTTASFKQCYTQLENAPVARPKGAKPCAAGELNDWGIWCTANFQHLTYLDAERAGVADFNGMYAYAMGNSLDYKSIPDDSLSPEATAFFKRAGGASSLAASPTQAPSALNRAAPEKTADCDVASAAGAAVGSALGGRDGAAVGSALGGLGRKIAKKTGC